MRYGSRLVWAGVAAMATVTATWSATGAESAARVRPVPLGGALAEQEGDQSFGVYVPTRFGGALTVESTAGTVGPILGPDGRERPNGKDSGAGKQGWNTFKVAGADAPYTVKTTFVQVGESTRKPWNFYYWPTKSDAIHEPWAGGNGRVDTLRAFGDDQLVASPGAAIEPGQDIVRAGPNGILETPVARGDGSTWFPNLYDDLTFRGADGTIYGTPSPLLKYDQIFHVSARSWEASYAQNQDISRWPGHCLGGAVASILLNEPTPAPGSGLTSDELKALWAELGENHYNHRIGDWAAEIAPGPPRPGPDACDKSVPAFHAVLEAHLRGKNHALLGNLRAFPPRGTTNEVWNHGIGKFTAAYVAIPGKGERSVKLEVDLEANAGSSLNGQDTKPRLVHYEYTLIYGLDGEVDETMTKDSDWIGVGGEALFAPMNLMEVVETRWAGHNPYVTETNVRSLDMANGGNPARFAGVAPRFRPIVSPETGLAPRIAASPAIDAPSPRRGLLGRLFRGG